MRFNDVIMQAYCATSAARVRTMLMLIAMAIGVGSVILLTSLGDSARRYITNEFAALGTNLLVVLPGRNETTGGAPPMFGETPRDLTIDDAMALLRSPHVSRIAPIAVGSAPIQFGGREREVSILGSTAAMFDIRHLEMGRGRFLPAVNPNEALSVCVIGHEIQTELFGAQSPLGRWLRVGDRRFRVIGVLAEGGVSIGVDFDDLVLVPVASAQMVFNNPSLFRVLVEARHGSAIDAAAEDVRRIIKERHEGEADVTVITQDSVVATFDRIFRMLTLAVGGIAAISLAVAGILIMNIMLVSVTQRTTEIGLLKALGAKPGDIRILFLTEALLLTSLGAVTGAIAGVFSALLLGRIYPVLPITPPVWAIAAAVIIALITGLLFGVIPASRAARLDPIAALSRR